MRTRCLTVREPESAQLCLFMNLFDLTLTRVGVTQVGVASLAMNQTRLKMGAPSVPTALLTTKPHGIARLVAAVCCAQQVKSRTTPGPCASLVLMGRSMLAKVSLATRAQ
jgi:hypothetical protein